MYIPKEIIGIRKRRCTRCVCPVKNHKNNVADGLYGEHSWGDFYDEEGKPDGWACYMAPDRTCKGCDAVLRELIK